MEPRSLQDFDRYKDEGFAVLLTDPFDTSFHDTKRRVRNNDAVAGWFVGCKRVALFRMAYFANVLPVDFAPPAAVKWIPDFISFCEVGQNRFPDC